MKPPAPKPRPISTFLRELVWHVLLADGTDRPAREGEVGRYPVSGYTTNLLRSVILERDTLRKLLVRAQGEISRAKGHNCWSLCDDIQAALSKGEARR